MNSRQIIKRLDKEGFVHIGTRGSHHRFRHKDGRRVTVLHPKKDFTTGTLINIFKQAGWDWKSRD